MPVKTLSRAAFGGILSLLVAAIGVPALAQQSGQPMPGMKGNMPGMDMPSSSDGNGSTTAFKAANDKMMKGMGVPLTGQTDKDFVAGMIPHHQGAVDMAQVELKYGKDPQMKTLAKDIIAAQKKEIAFMQEWQKKQGVEPTKQ
ncbi:MAG: hypothetical protein JWO51_1621 [Rhodospirillales bacterium]|nr:hypothetical protein [Rhodospirillales bacterium]